jgi:hypothetical protein
MPVSVEELSLETRLREQAVSKYDSDFLKQFASSGKETQKNLEEFMINLSNQDLELFVVSMLTQAYELNHVIPNIELMVYKIFFSPMTTEEERKGNSDLLAGNLFAQK